MGKFHYLVKNLTAAGVLGIKFIPYLSLKLSLTLPHKGKMNLFLHQNAIFDNFVEKT